MPYIILGLAIIIGLVLIVRGLAASEPRRAWAAVKVIGVVIVVIVVLSFAATHGIGTTLLTVALLAPVLLRWRGLGRLMRNMRGPSPGRTSDVETAFLRMTLDHDSGILDGTVLRGGFRGRRLQEMSEAEVFELLRECRIEDEQSAAVIETYLDRIYGAAWRSGKEGEGAGSRRGPSPGSAAMTPDEAYQILGLQPGATTEQIKDAHHKLMLKLHPDQGGSTYLATKINQAKDLLVDN